jgi:hypothetical protein
MTEGDDEWHDGCLMKVTLDVHNSGGWQMKPGDLDLGPEVMVGVPALLPALLSHASKCPRPHVMHPLPLIQ